MEYICLQKTFRLKARSKGSYLITDEIEASCASLLSQVAVGTAHIFLHHTSASLCLNENADPTVRADVTTILDRVVPERDDYTHDYEGSDDCPAHGKTALMGVDLTMPVNGGRFVLGTWQGVYLCEHRYRGGRRQLTVTVQGGRTAKRR
eukprot:gnl/Dysnectes_brevis/7672_a13090_327.p1 GENE.gnl/Dysnectes_brevis/7672_a13090_327~~gnl/Dysnectes_brevis/7672_a13090_327.p1  ORF type:complete len:149 (-),score=22.53 gnl/Dysnectes_brevis/7672_a13090_327:22-468(-)